MLTFYEEKGEFEGKTFSWVGDGCNMCNSYINASKILRFNLKIATPNGFEPDASVLNSSSDTVELCDLPVNYFIFKAALNEGYLQSKKEIAYIFILGASTFALFEQIGPKVMQITTLLSVIFYFIFNKYEYKRQLSKNSP